MRLGVISGNTLVDYMMALSIIDNDNEDLFIYRQYLDKAGLFDEPKPKYIPTVNKLKLSDKGPEISSKKR